MTETFNLSSSVESLFERWPKAIDIFIQHQMACPGCYLSGFESLEDALRVYQIKQEPFLEDLRQIISDQMSGENGESMESLPIPKEQHKHDHGTNPRNPETGP